MRNREPDCFDCQGAKIDPGDSGCRTLSNGDPGWPGEPACVTDCPRMQADQIDEMDESIAADGCPFFKPKIIKECHVCKKPINQPKYSWPLWGFNGWEDWPVCSMTCKLKVEIKEAAGRIYDKILAKRWRDNPPTEYWVCPDCGTKVIAFGASMRWQIDDEDRLWIKCQGCWKWQRPETTLE